MPSIQINKKMDRNIRFFLLKTTINPLFLIDLNVLYFIDM